MAQASVCSNLIRVVETKTVDGQSSTRVEALPFVVYGRRSVNASSTGAAAMVNGRPVTPLAEYFPGKIKSGDVGSSCGAQKSAHLTDCFGGVKAPAEKFVHYGAGFSSTSPAARCHFIVHPDWVSEKRRGFAALKGAGGAQRVSSGGLQYGSGSGSG